MNFLEFCSPLDMIDEQRIGVTKYAISFTNKRGNEFVVDFGAAVEFISELHQSYTKNAEFLNSILGENLDPIVYDEKQFRNILRLFESDKRLNSLVTLGLSQTKWLITVLTKLICYLGKFKYQGVHQNTRFDLNSVAGAALKIPPSLSDLTDATIDIGAAAATRSYEESFRLWMRRNTELKENSIEKYSTDAGKFVNKHLKAANQNFVGIFFVNKVVDLDSCVSQLESNPEYSQANSDGKGMYSSALIKYRNFLLWLNATTPLPKPFVLLAGISGTGKSRYVREQALFQDKDLHNFSLISVRPDWHEPSDLLGYVSRIDGEKYVPTPFLKFIVAAWRNAAKSVTGGQIVLKPLEEISTYWACLDEMNLAPVEQYFADYLSVLETRVWEGSKYTCDALVRPAQGLQAESALLELQEALGLKNDNELWLHFKNKGISLPPNLVVVGTVNMDETTHGFSRKVIDRALTIDFGEFFPNNFDDYFSPSVKVKPMGFPHFSRVTEADLSQVAADHNGKKSIEFLNQINKLLKGSSFELAYRALNELLICVKSFSPSNEMALHAVWDDFIMMKLLPRLEGDAEKLRLDGDESLLTRLLNQLPASMREDSLRPDFYRTNLDGSEIQVQFQSRKKIKWMHDRLMRHSFTSFWP
jgi:hypothetical protein